MLVAPAIAAAKIDRSTDAESDLPTLIAVYRPTDGPNWVNNTNWLSNVLPEDWYHQNKIADLRRHDQ